MTDFSRENTGQTTVTRLDNIVVVLVEPQDDINIGNTVRACKNFGITRIRLVAPASADPARIAISAPKADDVIAAIERFETVDEALGDCTFVAALTARRRKASWAVVEPRGAAIDLVSAASEGLAAVVFGREDAGLPNEVLDRCHVIVTVPTNPDYSSLNLGQAVLLMAWEIFRVAEQIPVEQAVDAVQARGGREPADLARLEPMFGQAERALTAIEFFKTQNGPHIMRAVRAMFLRAGLDKREAALWHGIFSEIEAFMKRTGRDAN
ncbi:MAG: RNA methyltransferase [Bradymonadaceae bacterium]|nr:RNA methyltransferase [Lujinxingiaceae bacterium]